MKDESTSMGLLGWLLITFIALKLMGYIDWSWFWVLSPFTIPAIALVVVWIVCLIMDSNKKN